MQDGARCRQVETVLDELEAVGHVMARVNPGDLVVLCVDQHAKVLADLEERTQHAQAGARAGGAGGAGAAVSDPDLDPGTLTESAEAEGTEAEGEALGAVDAQHEKADDTAI
jgi:cyanophycin synthetase